MGITYSPSCLILTIIQRQVYVHVRTCICHQMNHHYAQNSNRHRARDCTNRESEARGFFREQTSFGTHDGFSRQRPRREHKADAAAFDSFLVPACVNHLSIYDRF